LEELIDSGSVDWRFNYIPVLLKSEILLNQNKFAEVEELLRYETRALESAASPHHLNIFFRLQWEKGNYVQALDLVIPFYKNFAVSRYPYGGNLTFYLCELAFLDYNIGRIHEDAGNPEEAVKHYQQFLENFKDSDLGIPEKEDAIRRLERLTLFSK